MRNPGRSDLAPPGDRGFTLIEILVVLTIIAAIVGIAVPILTSVSNTKDATLCKSNLKSIGGALHLHHQRFKHYPGTQSGIQFLLAPLKKRMVDFTEDTIRNMYVCPGDDRAMQRVGEQGVREAYSDLDNLDPGVISYAGRNTQAFPLQRRIAGMEVIACDAGGDDGNVMIHRHKINILYLDQHVSDIDVTELPEEDEKNFRVGPDSPLEALKKLNKNP